MRDIREVPSWDDLKQPGNWSRLSSNGTPYGIAIVCACGDVISLSLKVHTFKSFDPLSIEPSIGHYADDGKTFKCHYFIRNGQYVQA